MGLLFRAFLDSRKTIKCQKQKKKKKNTIKPPVDFDLGPKPYVNSGRRYEHRQKFLGAPKCPCRIKKFFV